MTGTAVKDLRTCLICGKHFRSVGHHVRAAHGISARDYRDMHGIPRIRKLTTPEVSEMFRAQARERGLGTDHDALRAMAREANARSGEVIADLVAAGRRWSGHNAIPRDQLEALIARSEAGERPYQVARDIGLSWSGLHGALKRHPRLLARYKALDVARGRSKGATIYQRVIEALTAADGPIAMADLAEALTGDRESSGVSLAVKRLHEERLIAVDTGKQNRRILTWAGPRRGSDLPLP